MRSVSLWLPVGARLWAQWGGGYRDQGGGCCDGLSRRGRRLGQVGAVKGEGAGYESILKLEPTGLVDGLDVK